MSRRPAVHRGHLSRRHQTLSASLTARRLQQAETPLRSRRQQLAEGLLSAIGVASKIGATR